MAWKLVLSGPAALAEQLPAHLLAIGVESFEERANDERIEWVLYGESAAALRAIAEQLSVQLGDSAASGQQAGAGLRAELSELDESWKTAWLDHLEPTQLTASWRVRLALPPETQACAGELLLSREFAFGYGEHSSTQLMARWLERLCRQRPGAKVLDAGCGTGILSLLAAKEQARCWGVDVSPEAIAASRKNAELNGVESRCHFAHGGPSATLPPAGGFDIVVANIEANVLRELAPEIAPILATQGQLALAGLLAEQRRELAEAYGAQGVMLTQVDRLDDWVLLEGRRKSPN